MILHQMSGADAVRRLAAAAVLAQKDWAGYDTKEKWEDRYFNLMMGLKDGNVEHFIDMTREGRGEAIVQMIKAFDYPMDEPGPRLQLTKLLVKGEGLKEAAEKGFVSFEF